MSFSPLTYALFADAVVAFHTAFVAFVVGGQVLILAGWASDWKWTRGNIFRIAHLLAIGYVVFEAWSGIACPLTVLENYFRELAGSGSYQMSFIGYWLNRLLFYDLPAWLFVVIYTVFFSLVAVTFFFYPPRFRHPA